MLSQEVIKKITTRIVACVPYVQAIYAYGSRIAGQVHPESDLDLALLLPCGSDVELQILAQLEGDLEAITGCSVEVAVLDRVRSIIHCKEVVANGILLFTADAAAVTAFEMMVLADYAAFCEDRAPVMKAYSLEACRE